MDCPTCGHAVKVVGKTTQHFEPTGCFQLMDDHELCEREIGSLKEAAREFMDATERGDNARRYEKASAALKALL